MNQEDEELEQRIERARLWMTEAKSPEDRRAYCAVMTGLIRLRSQAQIERMERERGLR